MSNRATGLTSAGLGAPRPDRVAQPPASLDRPASL